MNDYNELYHHGIKDQKWGQRRFQNPDGSLTPEGRIRYGVGEARKPRKSEPKRGFLGIKKSSSKPKQSTVKKEEKPELTPEEKKAKLKEDIMAKGDYKKALDNIELFSNQDLQTLIDRKTKMDAMRSMKVSEVKSKRQKIMDGAKALNDALNLFANLTGNSIRSYNNVVDIHNLKSDKKWKKIGGKDQNNNNKNDDD